MYTVTKHIVKDISRIFLLKPKREHTVCREYVVKSTRTGVGRERRDVLETD